MARLFDLIKNKTNIFIENIDNNFFSINGSIYPKIFIVSTINTDIVLTNIYSGEVLKRINLKYLYIDGTLIDYENVNAHNVVATLVYNSTVGVSISGSDNTSGGNNNTSNNTQPVITQYQETNLENGFIYSRFLSDGEPVIGRFGTTQQYATGINNITTDWDNRENLNYV